MLRLRVLGQFQPTMANSKSCGCLAHLDSFAMLCKLSFDMQNCQCHLNHYGAGSWHPENFAGCSPTAAFQWRSALQPEQHNCHWSPWVAIGRHPGLTCLTYWCSMLLDVAQALRITRQSRQLTPETNGSDENLSSVSSELQET